MRLLVVEDEANLAASIRRGLEEEGYAVDVAGDGEQGYAAALATPYDLLIIDWRLPRKDGRTLVRELRAQGLPTPILMLTALGGIDHRVAGLDAGADDYLTKPFAFEELLARLRALARRRARPEAAASWLRRGGVALDARRRQVRVGGKLLDLRPKEFALLDVFLRHPDEVLSRTVLAEQVWGSALYVTDNVIDVSMSRLRQKLSEALAGLPASDAVEIETIRGVGYRLVVEAV